MNPQKHQQGLLRLELIRAWKANDAILEGWAENSRILTEEIQRLTERFDQSNETNKDLKAKLRDALRQLAVHENHNNPSSKATLFAKKRKTHRRAAKRKEAAAGDASTVDDAGKRGARPGSPGVASAYRPDPNKIVEYVQEQCGECGRTDTIPGRTIQKVVLDLGECGRVICYLEKATPAFCRHCSVLTWPATASIPGTWAGPNLRRIIMNLHAVTPTVRGICYVLFTNHNVTLSEGAVSNCLSAMARHVREGGLVEAIGGDGPASEPLLAASRPPVAALPDGDGDGRPNLPSRFDPGEVPLLTRMEEEASMAPYVEFDESRVNVAGSKEMALVLLTPTLVITRIATDRAGDTIERLFWMVLDRPLVADMYRGGGAFRGDYQTCFVHVWRKAESLAIEHGIDSPEQTYSQMLLDIYYAAKEAAAAVTEMAGGPTDSACRIGLPARMVPGLADLVASSQARMADDLSKVVQAYRHLEVSHPETRKFAGTLERAAPYMPVFIGHPGMPGNTNNVERTIRGYTVRPRNIQRILPDWEAARTLEMLQSVHATCRIRGTFSGDIVAGNRGCWAFGSGKPPPVPGPP